MELTNSNPTRANKTWAQKEELNYLLEGCLYAFIPALLSLNSEIAANRTRTSAFEAIVLYLIVKKSTVPNEPN